MERDYSSTDNRVRQATLAIVGNDSTTYDEVLNIVRHVALLCDYIYGIDTPVDVIATNIVAHNIPDQIIKTRE